MLLSRVSILRRVSVLGLAILSIGGVVALASGNRFFSQITTQTIESQPGNQNQSRLAHNREGLIWVLNLTPEQVQKMQAIRRQYKDQILQTTQQLRQAKQQLSDAIAGTAPADEVRAKHRQVDMLQQQLGDLRFETTLEVRELLTPEQRIKYVETMQKQQQKVQKLVMQAQKQS